MAKPIEIDVKVNGLTQIKQDLKALKGELVNATDPKEIERLSQAAGALSDKIADASEKIKVFAAGSNFEKVSNGLGLIGDQLSSLDFEGARESAALLRDTIKTMNPAEVIKGFKDFTATIGSLGKAFIEMGIKLLANPLFLLVAVVVSIIAVIVAFKDKIKILSQAFDLLTAPIKKVIQSLKDLTDQLGLTTFAEDEATDKAIANAKRREDAIEKTTELYADNFNRRLKILKAQGADTYKEEKKFLDEQSRLYASQALEAEALAKDLAIKKQQAVGEQRESLAKAEKEQWELKAKYIKLGKDSEAESQALTEQRNTDARNKRKKDDEDDRKEKDAKDKEALDKLIANRKAELAIINATQDELDTIRIEKEIKTQKALEEIRENDKQKFLNQYKDRATQQANIDNILLEHKKENLDFQIGYAEQASAIFQDIFGKSKDQLKAGVVIDGAINIAKIITSTQAANAAALLPPPFGLGPIAGSAFGIKNTISASLGIAATVAATAKALQTINSGGGSSSGGSNPKGNSGGSAVPIGTTSGQANQSNTTANKTTEVGANGQPIIVKAYVSETEITNSQNTVKKINESARI